MPVQFPTQVALVGKILQLLRDQTEDIRCSSNDGRNAPKSG